MLEEKKEKKTHGERLKWILESKGKRQEAKCADAEELKNQREGAAGWDKRSKINKEKKEAEFDKKKRKKKGEREKSEK